MATIKVTKASSVQSIKSQFSKEFSCNIRIYNGIKFADDKMKISDLSKTDNPGGDLELGARSRVENVEKYFKETFDINNLVKLDNIQLMKFLENPEKDWIIDKAKIEQLSFF